MEGIAVRSQIEGQVWYGPKGLWIKFDMIW